VKKFRIFFLELLAKFNDFVNSDDCIEKIASKSIGLKPVIIQKRFEVDKDRFYLVKKI